MESAYLQTGAVCVSTNFGMHPKKTSCPQGDSTIIFSSVLTEVHGIPQPGGQSKFFLYEEHEHNKIVKQIKQRMINPL
jgi:hypothetical protein